MIAPHMPHDHGLVVGRMWLPKCVLPRTARGPQATPVERAETATILWVRHCCECRRIDRREWFDVAERAGERTWICPGCGSPDYSLLKTRW